MSIRLVRGEWSDLGADAMAIRCEVFVEEQGVPLEMEHDDADITALHLLALNGASEHIGTGRLLPDGHIGRLAVRKNFRRCGVGRLMMQRLLEEAIQRGHQEVILHAQTSAASFYEQFGFLRYGAEFDEAGIPHVAMRKTL